MTLTPFNKPFATGYELDYIRQAIENGHLSGDGSFTKLCSAWLQKKIGSHLALLTHSCTAALEMAAILAEIGPGDEVIMPSYTFVSTANAFVLRGATPVFVDIRPDTHNMNEAKLEEALSDRTRAIVPVHYAGVSCEMDRITAFAEAHQLLVIEDAAQGILSTYRGRPLGSIGHLSALSFHETKNLIAGEGGCLLVNDKAYETRAQIVREKGTNRTNFLQGLVDKYTWVDVGSSFLPSEINAAFLYAQLERADGIQEQREAMWNAYHEMLAPLEASGYLQRPHVPAHCIQNYHMYYVRFPNLDIRTRALNALRGRELHAVFHYVPLHSSPAGKRFGRPVGDLPVTQAAADGLLRLPFWVGMGPDKIAEIVDVIVSLFARPRLSRNAPRGEVHSKE